LDSHPESDQHQNLFTFIAGHRCSCLPDLVNSH